MTLCRTKTRYLYILSAILLVLSFSSSNILSGSVDTEYIDLDGDGINDNIYDSDNDGIPDDFQSGQVGLSTAFTGFNASFGTNQKDPILNLTLSQTFKLNQYSTRNIGKCRSDYESGFGTKIGFSNSSGGACAGGVCF